MVLACCLYSRQCFLTCPDRWKLCLVSGICHTSWIGCCGDVVSPTGHGVAGGERVFLHFGTECPFNFPMLAFFFPGAAGGALAPSDLLWCRSACLLDSSPQPVSPPLCTWLTSSLCSHLCRRGRQKLQKLRSQDFLEVHNRNMQCLINEHCMDTVGVMIHLKFCQCSDH